MKIDTAQFRRLVKELEKIPQDTVDAAGAYFKNITPIDTGNARRNTRTRRQTIEANYAYAGRLDEGYSRQAPDGMSDPTIDFMEEEINKQVGRL